MKPEKTQTIYLEGRSENYWCEGCRYFIQGIGNWGGCTVVGAVEGEMDGNHIHRKSSCKYWAEPQDSGPLATKEDVSGHRFSKADALYGTTGELEASPLGFSCKNCEYWQAEQLGCLKLEGSDFKANDCSDAWHPSAEALKVAQAHEDQRPPASREEADKLAELYGPKIGEEIERSLNETDLEKLLKSLKENDIKTIVSFYEKKIHNG